MRLSGWVEIAPRPEAVAPKVLAVVQTMLTMLGAEADPHGWVAWGDDPGARWTVFAATDAGLVQVNARVNVPGEGPRASGKLIRWARAQVGDLAVEMQGGHRILSFTLEGQVLRGQDDSADLVAAFVLDVLDAMDGRPRQASAPATSTKKAPSKAGEAGSAPSRASEAPAKGKTALRLDAPKETSS